MSANPSKEVVDRVRSGPRLLSAYEVEGPHLAASFVDETRSHLEVGDEEPRTDGVSSSSSASPEAPSSTRTTSSPRPRAGNRCSVGSSRKTSESSPSVFVAFHRLVQGQYVDPDLANLGLEPMNVRDGITVVRRGELVGERSRRRTSRRCWGSPASSNPSTSPDIAPYVAEIRKKAAAFLALSHEINEAHRASDRPGSPGNGTGPRRCGRAKDDFDRFYLRAARTAKAPDVQDSLPE